MCLSLLRKPKPHSEPIFIGNSHRSPHLTFPSALAMEPLTSNPEAIAKNRGTLKRRADRLAKGGQQLNALRLAAQEKLMELFSETFRYLPLAHVLENQALACPARAAARHLMWLWLSKPVGSHFGLGAPPILEPILVGIGMFTGGTIWLLTHGHVIMWVAGCFGYCFNMKLVECPNIFVVRRFLCQKQETMVNA